MRCRRRRLLAAWLCGIPSVAAIGLALGFGLGWVHSDDSNLDGRPDTWRFYNARARLEQIAIDNNLDGRWDVREYYDHGILIRRDSDRDFDYRVDLVEEFDPTTHTRSRSVVDIDHDGTADFLVLFRDGAPAFSKRLTYASSRAASVPVAPRRGGLRRAPNDYVAPLVDPSQADLAIRGIQTYVEPEEWLGLSTSGGLPGAIRASTSPDVSSSDVPFSSAWYASSALILPFPPRGPPLVTII